MCKQSKHCECGREITIGVWVDLVKTEDGVVFPVIKPVPYEKETDTFNCDELFVGNYKVMSFDTEAFTKEEIKRNGFEIAEDGHIINAGALCPYCNKWL